MERSGTRWTQVEVQAMRDLHTECHYGDWEQFRIQRETRHLHPHRLILDGISLPVAA